MQRRQHSYREALKAQLIYSAIGLSTFSLMVTWSIEQLAETLFLNW